ncbi:hypothetical protein NL108_018516 [Boleophthalmus pectinirostris]|uniref:sodium channel subunit beta-3-like n=1 Tax=Boleophthalmus pectinirostris TaxID=150288 RepID=UPI00243227E1|nr:sodium channel subunit beta-3-like [Boleophthalmus pectinirostris]KAJ0050393.1 hypothetical protein NL108_018516 [Boleophthalmus pectinirostris]
MFFSRRTLRMLKFQLLLVLFFVLLCFSGAVDSCIFKKHENDSVTLEFNFPPKFASKPVDIICVQNQSREFFHQDNGKEETDYQNKHFRGRVQANVTALRDGVFKTHISPLLLGDSGLYSCNIQRGSEVQKTSDCRLSVSAAPESTQEPPEEQPGHALTGLWAALGLVGIVVFITVFLLVWFRSQVLVQVSDPGLVQVRS